MPAVSQRVSLNSCKSLVISRIADTLRSYPLETLLDMEERLLHEHESPASQHPDAPTINLTIMEVTLLVSFRRLPDDQRRSDVASALAAFAAPKA